MKRIIILFDGTWNSDSSSKSATNIVLLREKINDYITHKVGNDSKDESIINFVAYYTGVGTEETKIFRGGLFGYGLEENVRQGYSYLSRIYEYGDQVFIFGFSRGAYTARSLVGYIAASGLLKPEQCTVDREKTAWKFYKTNPYKRNNAIREDLKRYSFDSNLFKIDVLGVFDTVGSLGIPKSWITNPYFYIKSFFSDDEFHDVLLPTITRVNLHALAIDERRGPFMPTKWYQFRYRNYPSITEQVWFSGSHSDIGGGYDSASLHNPIQYNLSMKNNHRNHPLSDISLDWMIKRIKYHYHDFPCEAIFPTIETKLSLEEEKKYFELMESYELHDSRKFPSNLLSMNIRSISDYPLEEADSSAGKISPFEEPISEMIHISALQMLMDCKKNVRIVNSKKLYRPINLINILNKIQDSYSYSGFCKSKYHLFKYPVKVVSWTGQVYDADNFEHCEIIRQLINSIYLNLYNDL